MKLLAAILLIVSMLYAQDPQSWWNSTDSEQRAFARQCIEYGSTLGALTSWTDRPGETLAGIAQMEVSFVEDLEHDEDSSGPFGLSDDVRRYYNGRTRNGIILDGRSETFEADARIALALFNDNYLYFSGLGYDPREAWFWAAARYNGGNNPNLKYAIKFNERVRFLKNLNWD